MTLKMRYVILKLQTRYLFCIIIVIEGGFIMSGPGKGDALGYNTEQVEAIGEGINK